MDVWVGSIVLEVLFGHTSLLIVEQTSYFLHVDDPIDLSCCQPAQPVLPGRDYSLAVHVEFVPVVRNQFLLGLLFGRRLGMSEG